MAFLDTIGNVASSFLGASGAAKAAKEQAAASRYSTDVQAGLQREQTQLQREQEAARLKAYQNMLDRAGDISASGEAALYETASKSPEELQQMKQDLLSGTSEELGMLRGEMGAGLAQQGIRGGQAATQMRRGLGEYTTSATRDINQLMAEDAQRRQAALLAYQNAKGMAGTQGQLSLY
uniref:Uncharacterized protein n=1 Tax=viral metagenome TaxID=1070528 RepID=A0A6M3IZ67_9ZZZZ